jgi:hypothetical protein
MSTRPSIVLKRKAHLEEKDMTTTEHNVVTTTTHQKRRARGRIAAATMVAAGAVVAGALGTGSPANANVDYYVALAYSWQSNVGGMANNQTEAEPGARHAALRNCQDVHGGNNCTWYGTFKNECAALAVDGEKDWATGTGPLFGGLQTAEQNALAANPGGRIVASGCARTGAHGRPLPPLEGTVVPLPPPLTIPPSQTLSPLP